MPRELVWSDDPTPRKRRMRLLVLGPPKCGKAQPLSEVVLTPTGWKAIGKIRVGDFVIGSNGKPTLVEAVRRQGKRPIVKMTVDDGETVRCDEEHLWSVTTKRALRSMWVFPPGTPHQNRAGLKKIKVREEEDLPVVKTALEIAAGIATGSVEDQHFLPWLSGPVRFEPRAPLEIEPYFLGLLLGDDCFRQEQLTLTKNDQEILDAVAKGAAAMGDPSTFFFNTNKCPAIRVRGGRVKKTLAVMGLDDHLSPEKFIPDHYLYASPRERLALLRGLCDTDGYCVNQQPGKKGLQCEFSTSSSNLRDDVTQLVRGLGGRVLVRPKETPSLPAWSLMISFADGTNPFQLPRKAELWNSDPERKWRKRIVSVEPDGVEEAVCIQVAARDSLYVTAGHILTHNSTAVVGTCSQPSYVINCDQDNALDHITDIYPNARFAQEKYPVHTMDAMERALFTARKLAREGTVKTVILDTLSGFSKFLLKECEELNPDGRKYYPAYTNYIVNVCSRICEIPAHVIVTSHYIDVTPEESAEAAKTGPGIVPLLETKGAKARVGGEFSDVVFLENHRSKGRIFVTDMQGVWGPGCRNIHGKKVDTSYKANIKTLMRAMGMLKPRVANGEGEGEAGT